MFLRLFNCSSLVEIYKISKKLLKFQIIFDIIIDNAGKEK